MFLPLQVLLKFWEKMHPFNRYSSSHLVSHNQGFSGLPEEICLPIYFSVWPHFLPPYSPYRAPILWRNFFLSGDLVKRDGSWLLEGIQSKWCEKTCRAILACWFCSSLLSLYILTFHVHWLWSSLWISFEIWSLLHCYFVTPSLVQQVFMQLLVGVHYWIHHCILYSLADAHVLFYCMWITLLYMYIYYQLAWLI